MASRFGHRLVIIVLAFTILSLGAGCNKSSSSSGPGNEFFVALGPPDCNPDGTIKDSGLDKIKQAAGESNVVIRMGGHSVLSDLGLAQLGQFKNIHRVIAPSSRVTPAGIDKLKKALPNVEVEK
jgi:hypothetical protein